jgi:hypothetical protein
VLLWCLQKGRKQIEGSHRPDGLILFSEKWSGAELLRVDLCRGGNRKSRWDKKYKYIYIYFFFALHHKISIKWTKVPGVGSSHLWRPGGWSLMAAKMRCQHHASEN